MELLPKVTRAAWLPVLVMLLEACWYGAECSRILAVFAMKGKSHMMVNWPPMLALGARGHQVDVYAHFAPDAAMPNVTFHQLKHSEVPSAGLDVSRFEHPLYRFVNPILSPAFGQQDCAALFRDPTIRELIQSEKKYDLFVTELFNTDCYLGFGHRFQAPVVAISTSVIMPWGNWRFGNPENPAYIPNMYSGYDDEMNLVQRTVNAVVLFYAKVVKWLIYERQDQAVIDQAFGPGQPPVGELARNTSLMLVNTFHALSLPRPFVTNVIEVGGIHISENGPNALPRDLDQFVSGAEHGVVLFSLGSMIRTSSLSRESAAGLLRALGSLKQRVVWKWEDEPPSDVPANVRLSKWLPQFDVLCHNNTRLFIGHGGLLSTSEAAYCGVPLLGVGFYGDQRTNLAAIAKAGAGRSVTYSTLKDADLFIKHAKEILDDPSFQNNAKALSARFRDRPMSPLQTAVYWIEYVMRHNGAPHLRGAARHLAWYEEALLDVYAVVAAVLLILWVAVRALLRMALQALRLLAPLAGPAPKKKKQA